MKMFNQLLDDINADKVIEVSDGGEKGGKLPFTNGSMKYTTLEDVWVAKTWLTIKDGESVCVEVDKVGGVFFRGFIQSNRHGEAIDRKQHKELVNAICSFFDRSAVKYRNAEKAKEILQSRKSVK